MVDALLNMQSAPASTPATGYIASATAVTDIVATPGVNSDITDLMTPLLSTTAGDASTPHVADPLLRKRKSSDTLQSPHVRAGARTQVQDDGIQHEIFHVNTPSGNEMEEAASVHAATLTSPRTHSELGDVNSDVEHVKEDLKEVEKMLEFLVRREGKVLTCRRRLQQQDWSHWRRTNKKTRSTIWRKLSRTKPKS